MKLVLHCILYIVAVTICVYIVMLNQPITNTYDCRMLMGGWHPDVPNQVMQQCKEKLTKG
jgi:hypothetical protein